jgi:hypothetical protein
MQRTDREMPRILIYSVALTIGVLAALAVLIWFSRGGLEPAGMWQNLFSAKTLQLRAAGPLWASAGAAFIASGATAAALSRLPLPWREFRLLRWALAALIIFGLGHVGHIDVPAAHQPGANVAAIFGVLGAAALMALLGAYFTARR